jgi:3-phosphoshikimate 1-carboxyvinyltransferase
LGAKVNFLDPKTLVLDASECFKTPSVELDCGNSGTTMRIMSGVLAGQEFESTLIGDISLSKRPMRRVIDPLGLMGAKISSQSGCAPLVIHGGKLNGINYSSPIASAQVKSCLLLAGLNAEGCTSVTEPELSRDHTERMLKYFEADIETRGLTVTVASKSLVAHDLEVAGDISSAAFFLVAASIVPNSEIIVKNIGLNPTRTGVLDVLEKMGANIEILDKRLVSNEDVGDVKVSYSEGLKGIEIAGEIIPRLIDELPVIAVLATQAKGTTVVKDAWDLRNKECDRIRTVVRELAKMGADIEETADGFIINGSKNGALTGDCDAEVYHDHRLAMSWFVASLVAKNPIKINGFEWANTSFPEFSELFAALQSC